MANRPQGHGRDDARQGPGALQEGHGRDAEDGEVRHRDAREGIPVLRSGEPHRADSMVATRAVAHPMMTTGTTTRAAIEAVWRIESARLIGALAGMVRDVGLAEDMVQEALVNALERWPETGIPENPGAWLMATAKNRAIDQLRRRRMLERKHGEIQKGASHASSTPDFDDALDEDVGDDIL